MDQLRRDARHAFRLLVRKPGFSAVAVLTLALGIGANTAIFSVVHAVLIRPLPYAEPDRLAQFLLHMNTPVGPQTFDALPVSAALTWRSESQTLSSLAVFNNQAMTLAGSVGPHRLTGVAASPDFFETLRVTPVLGRTFVEARETDDARLVVLSHGAWNRYFSGDAAVVGSTISLDGADHLVTGVMPEGFAFPAPDVAFWVPLLLRPSEGRGMVLPAVGRLIADVTLAEVQQEGLRYLEADGVDSRFTMRLEVVTLQDQMVGGVRRVLWILMAAVGLVLLIAAVNIALLLLTRGASRQREFSVRMALGAGRWHLVRQLFIESLMLGGLGGVAGLILAAWSMQALMGMAPASLPRLDEVSLDRTVLGFTLGLTVLTSLVFGVLSAGKTLQFEVLSALGRTSDGRGAAKSAGSPFRRLTVLAAGEVALTMVLLVAAGLLLRSFVHLVTVDQGFESGGSVAFQISLPSTRYPGSAARLAFYDQLLDRLVVLPGVDDAGLITAMPNRRTGAHFGFQVDGAPQELDPFSMPAADVRMASEGFFEALGVPLLAGRGFRPTDGALDQPVVVISDALARQYFPGRDPVGEFLEFSAHGTPRIVGVVGDVRPAALDEQLAVAAYLPFRQNPGMFGWTSGMNVVVRTSGDPSDVTATIQSLVLSFDPEMPVFNVRTMSDEVNDLVAAPRFSAVLLALFAGVALVMAGVGVYGVLAYGVGQRAREIGLRMALGATRRQVLRLTLLRAAVALSVGMSLGLIAALALSRLLTSLLYGVTPADPVTVASVAATLLVVGLVAAVVPARRALRVTPMQALRED